MGDRHVSIRVDQRGRRRNQFEEPDWLALRFEIQRRHRAYYAASRQYHCHGAHQVRRQRSHRTWPAEGRRLATGRRMGADRQIVASPQLSLLEPQFPLPGVLSAEDSPCDGPRVGPAPGWREAVQIAARLQYGLFSWALPME